MSVAEAWEQLYRKNQHMSVWPWSDLVAFIMRYVRPTGPGFRVLELGCGAGANIPFFRNLEVEYYAIEGSPTIVNKLHERYPDLREKIVVGDFTQELPFDVEFDLIVDRSSLTHNSTAAIRAGLTLAGDKLKPCGAFVGIDWFSVEFSEYRNGEDAGDAFTKKNFRTGSLADTGVVHFSDKEHLLELFSAFKVEVLVHKVVERHLPPDGWRYAAWNLVAWKRT